MVALTLPLDNRAVLAKIERARSRLMASDAWFGTLALKLRIKADTRFPLMATDGTHLFYNPAGCDAASEPELIFVWAHEILHCGLCHMFRKPAAIDWHEWNVCTDLVINDLLIIKGVGARPAGILHDVQYRNLSAEQVAHLRRKARQQAEQDKQAEQADQPDDDDSTDTENEQDADDDDDGSQDADTGENADDAAGDENESADDGAPDDSTGSPDDDSAESAPGQPGNQDADDDAGDGTGDAGEPGQDAGEPTLGDGTLEAGDDCLPPAVDADADDADSQARDTNTQTDWEMAVEQAAAVSRKAGEMDGGIERVIAGTRTTRTDWREVLRRFVEATNPSDYTWQRPNRRYQSQGLYLPGTHKANTPPIVVVVDTSGSVGQTELDVFATELTNILTDCKPRAVHVIYCDTRVNGDAEVFTPDDGEVVLTTRGGGGTYFQPAFDWVANAIDDGTLDERPAAILYLTDGYAADLYSLTEPDVPTLFAIVPGGTTDMPFGEAIEMEVD